MLKLQIAQGAELAQEAAEQLGAGDAQVVLGIVAVALAVALVAVGWKAWPLLKQLHEWHGATVKDPETGEERPAWHVPGGWGKKIADLEAKVDAQSLTLSGLSEKLDRVTTQAEDAQGRYNALVDRLLVAHMERRQEDQG